MSYANESRCVFSCLLKTPKSLIVRRCFASVFHFLGAPAKKAVSSLTLSFWHIQEEGLRGSQAVLRMLDLKHVAEVRWSMSCQGPEGDWADFKLDSERYRYPVQSFKTGLIHARPCLGILQRTLAAEFWTIWSLWIKTFGSPAKRALQSRWLWTKPLDEGFCWFPIQVFMCVSRLAAYAHLHNIFLTSYLNLGNIWWLWYLEMGLSGDY